MKTRTPFHRRGSTLMLVFWALLVLSIAVLGLLSYIRQTIIITGESYNDSEARAMAHSGVALALHPLVSKETPLLADWQGMDPGFEVKLISEGSKLNINTLLAGEDPRRIDLLKRWMETRGIEFKDREMLIARMLDFIDADNLARIDGMEDGPGYHPTNRGRFTSLEEIQQVSGSEVLTETPGWKDDLTIYSGGQVDITAADEHILRLLPGMNDAGIQRFLQWRRGPDQVDGTLDDPPLQNLDTARQFLGMDKQAFNALGGLISQKDNTWRVISRGHAGKVVRQIEVVAVKGSQNPQIRLWKE